MTKYDIFLIIFLTLIPPTGFILLAIGLTSIGIGLLIAWAMFISFCVALILITH